MTLFYPFATLCTECGTQLTITQGGFGKPTLTTFDLSGISGESVTYSYTDPNAQSPTTYYFSPCGDTQESCDDPVKDPSVGMGIQITEDSTKGEVCDVLGAFSTEDADWEPLLEDDTGDFIGLQMTNNIGSKCESLPNTFYSLTVNFNCYMGNPKDRIKAGPEATGFIAQTGSGEGDGCSAVYQINSCLACADACALPLVPSPTSDGPAGGPGWFGWLLIVVFLIIAPVYIIGGFVLFKRLPPPFDRCLSLSRRTSMQAGNEGYTTASNVNYTSKSTSYGSVADSL